MDSSDDEETPIYRPPTKTDSSPIPGPSGMQNTDSSPIPAPSGSKSYENRNRKRSNSLSDKDQPTRQFQSFHDPNQFKIYRSISNQNFSI